MSFTPGPWSVLDHTKEPPTQEILCIPETGFALECEPFESISDTDRANAILHAAAPDLLEALEDAYRHIAFDADLPVGFYGKAEAAIKKARGEAVNTELEKDWKECFESQKQSGKFRSLREYREDLKARGEQ